MDKHTMPNTSTDNATPSITLITKEQCHHMDDAALLELVQHAQGHTKDFQTFMNCDFSYTYLTSLLKERGYENGWYHSTNATTPPSPEKTTIPMKKSDSPTVRQSYLIDETTADEWRQFNKNVPFKTVTLGWALRRFMDDVRAGRIVFELEI